MGVLDLFRRSTRVEAGEVPPIRVARVKATGTTATGIVALW